jgi:hypothetical protein
MNICQLLLAFEPCDVRIYLYKSYDDISPPKGAVIDLHKGFESMYTCDGIHEGLSVLLSLKTGFQTIAPSRNVLSKLTDALSKETKWLKS